MSVVDHDGGVAPPLRVSSPGSHTFGPVVALNDETGSGLGAELDDVMTVGPIFQARRESDPNAVALRTVAACEASVSVA